MSSSRVGSSNSRTSRGETPEHYYEQPQWLFGVLLATVIVSLLKEEAREHRPPQGANFGFYIYPIVLSVTGIVAR